MKLIEEIESRRDQQGVLRKWGVFWCDFCLEEVIREYYSGLLYNSCGCRKGSITHGETGARLHIIWKSMKKRCSDINNKYYGGRNIIVCPEWANDYIKFRDWALNNGYADSLEIDRIKTNGNYEPSNCQWLTHTENMRKTNRCKITLNLANEIKLKRKEGISCTQLAKEYNISRNSVSNIINNKSWDK